MDRGDRLRRKALFQTPAGQVTEERARGRSDHLQRAKPLGQESVHGDGDSEPLHGARLLGMDGQRRLPAGGRHPVQSAGIRFRAVGRDRTQADPPEDLRSVGKDQGGRQDFRASERK